MATRLSFIPRADSSDSPALSPRITRIMGAPIAAVSQAAAVDAIITSAVAKTGYWTITANLAHLRRYHRDPDAARLIDGADLTVADGAPLILASRIAGTPLPERVPGSDLIWALGEACAREGLAVFLLGGEAGVADDAAQVLVDRYHGLSICGTSCPAHGFDRDERALGRVEREVIDASPDLVLVALGFPKQDVVIERLRCALPGTSFIGIGIGLSFVTGDVPRAAPWAQALGLEWLHRLIQEPRRLARRYLIEGIPFAAHLFVSAAVFRLRATVQNAPRSRLWGTDASP